MKHLAVFASGNGTNAECLFSRFENDENAKIDLLISDRQEAFALKRAEKWGIKSLLIPRGGNFAHATRQALESHAIDFIVLAGFLWRMPGSIVSQFPHRIINLHPALLPKFGGKGFYGDAVHRAVIASHEKLSGITIHYVDEKYDSGEIIFQATCPVLPTDTPDSLASRIHSLEHKFLPEVTHQLVCNLD